MNQLNKLKSRILDKRGVEPGELSGLLDMARTFHCLGDILGRTYEIKDGNGKIKYIIEQKALNIRQVNYLIEQAQLLHALDAQQEAEKTRAMMGGRK